jgi:hypothetical protein
MASKFIQIQPIATGSLGPRGGLEQKTGRSIPHLFPHFTNGRRHQAGDQPRDWRKAWVTACRKAGIPGREPGRPQGSSSQDGRPSPGKPVS